MYDYLLFWLALPMAIVVTVILLFMAAFVYCATMSYREARVVKRCDHAQYAYRENGQCHAICCNCGTDIGDILHSRAARPLYERH